MRVSRGASHPARVAVELPETIIASEKLRGFRLAHDVRQLSSLFRARSIHRQIESLEQSNISRPRR